MYFAQLMIRPVKGLVQLTNNNSHMVVFGKGDDDELNRRVTSGGRKWTEIEIECGFLFEKNVRVERCRSLGGGAGPLYIKCIDP